MYIFCIVLILIASVLIILAVLAQNPKSGMAANFGVSNQVMGVRQTSDFLEKSTWVLSISIVVLSLLATVTMPSAGQGLTKSNEDRMIEQSLMGGESQQIPNQLTLPATNLEQSTQDTENENTPE